MEPKSKQNKSLGMYEKQVSTVFIRGLPMVSLIIDGKERVCLAQISNSLLKKFSYNEIHNRRVALGINCIQCTTNQLEVLRNAGAMPSSSRRCGMITKKEAERLINSFLEESRPPSLPESFSFEVEHKCEYGCNGVFYPSRYNSSRAKCIRCIHCSLYFSPNKFIFHSHEKSNIIYKPTNNLNINSWRKHITLVNPNEDEELNNAWEDVKSIFNSGKRKRSVTYVDSDSDSQINSSESAAKSPLEENNFVNHPIETFRNFIGNNYGFMNLMSPYQPPNLFLMPEFLQLNRNFLSYNYLTKPVNSTNFLVNCLLNKMENFKNESTPDQNESNGECSSSKNVFNIQKYLN
ncbi:SKI family transcriptional corepressor 2 [Brachionus plicatilis]|uniref:SKI family transcriptional corepressor 2 n=1 Tax=Brachionus plicatilis TaxID=10195 RepID=A0A3M7RAT6_BRAPC|nr:SKI family transcriptional corepressor 2 [Brachionus plicatilis]